MTETVTVSVALQRLQRLQDELHASLADPALPLPLKQKCLMAYNAANTELQRLLAQGIDALNQKYGIDENAAKTLIAPLKDLKDDLDKIKKAAERIVWLIDAVADVLKFVTLFA